MGSLTKHGDVGGGGGVTYGLPSWLAALVDGSLEGRESVMITVVGTRGSTPRETGAKMLVTQKDVVGTIGGGNLEYKAIELARERLREGSGAAWHCELRRFPLGPTLGQCCGGVATLQFEHLDGDSREWVDRLAALSAGQQAAVLVSHAEAAAGGRKLLVGETAVWGELGDKNLGRAAVEAARDLLSTGGAAGLQRLETQDAAGEDGALLLFEPFRPSDFHIVLFGAGHVGRALVNVLGALPCTVTWVDSRAEQFPRECPANVRILVRQAPELEVASAPGGSFFLVMTHSHPLDQQLCERVLRRNDFRYCGLIGSRSKRRKFEKRLVAEGVEPALLAKLVCPIGIAGIGGKQPAEIAVAVAAELLQVRSGALSPARPQGLAAT